MSANFDDRVLIVRKLWWGSIGIKFDIRGNQLVLSQYAIHSTEPSDDTNMSGNEEW